jgi:hypothetical protein
MSDPESVLRITDNDIHEANQLSLNCPICASPVEKNTTQPELQPVVCAACGTLYHRACWEGNRGHCAILGCSHDRYRVYGSHQPVITITAQELPTDAEVRRRSEQVKRLKRQEQQRVPPARPPSQGFWARLFERIARAFR